MSDAVDRASELEQMQRDIALQNHYQTREPAQDCRIARICMVCCQPIPKERVKARPEAVRCTECQLMVELKQKNYRKL